MDFGIGVFTWYTTGYDGMFMTFLGCVKSQMLILREAASTIRQRTLEKMNYSKNIEIFRDDDDPELEEKLYSELRLCALHLDKIRFRVCNEIEEIFGYTILVQLLGSLLALASSLFSFSHVSIGDSEMFSTVEYISALLIQLAMFCHFGNEITETLATVGFCLYDNDWFSASKRFKQSMIIMMSRLQKKVYISIGKFSPLTLATLVTHC
ncbi:hypothetical protein NQ318_003998 [Aromia moschata]|uniref:Uncharacterized protein n=1 Tax=Aromia moschata TaxID=1265417 RepID=A0AAV8Z7R2_9CUCU|nr:hypothetical protein NQ318_003998 [Aromia moschata]